MHGNRDFLIGEKFSKDCGIQLIDDPINININNSNILLMHGDSLCTEDTKYQEFRATTRVNSWKEDFLKKPIKERALIAEGLRSKSKIETRGKNRIYHGCIKRRGDKSDVRKSNLFPNSWPYSQT